MDDTNEINDKRMPKEFRGKTFSGFKKSDVKKQLINSMSSNKIENALYWSAEYVCAGHFLELWELIILFVSKQIYNANPKLPIYCELKFNRFKELMSGGYVGNELKLRNNQHIRNLFAEIITLICCSKKKSQFQDFKIPKDSFQLTELKHYLVADNMNYASYFQKDDPKELILAANELSYNLRSNISNSQMCYYWIEWMIEYIASCAKKNEIIKIERRKFIVGKVAEKYQKNPIWLIWDAMFHEAAQRRNSKIMLRIMNSLLQLYCIHFTDGCKKRRKYLLYFCVVLCTEHTNYGTEIIENKEFISNITTKINLIYKEIKKNEIRPDTDYLFNNMKQTSLDKTIAKLDMLNNSSFIPRS
jgi:hypothetical protein